ncbi:MAG: 3-keto-disaccharide hydrolase [Opitutales bacterium]
MKLIIVVSLCLFTSLVAQGNGWVDLFNGQNLDGWTEKTKEGSFRVEDGVIIGTARSGLGSTFLCSNEDYGDFELEFETKLIDNELNSGVQIRSKILEPKKNEKYGAVYGPQVEVTGRDFVKNYSGNIYGQGWKTWLTPPDSKKAHSFYKDGEWNHFRVVAKGDQITTWINGNEIVITTIPPERHETNPSGQIGLQIHGIKKGTGPYQVAWKNIRIKEL